MKLTAIALHNHLSHPDTRVEFNGTRLAAFVGPNGAGKSALLEAIKYVLFDDARGKTDQLVRIGQTDMSASIEFEYSGALYRATRGRSTKGAGKSYLELVVRSGDTWTPLSGDDIRATQAAIAELLGIDGDAFATAVFLGQGDADRFADATAGERKRILSTVLGLDVYARAEQRARDDVRDLEARTVAERSQVERLTEAIAELASAERLRDDARQAIEDLEADAAGDRDRRKAITARLTELAAELATADAAAADVARLEQERTALGERYRRERTTVADADAAVAGARVTLGSAGAVEQAALDLGPAREALAALEAREFGWRAANDSLAQRREALAEAMRPIEAAQATWTTELRLARQRVTDLTEAVNALEPVVCTKCGTKNVVDQAGLGQQLREARGLVKSLEASKPEESLALSRERAMLKREGEKLPAQPDPAEVAVARAKVTELERVAARGGEIAQAQSALDMAAAAKASAETELERIEASGRDVAARVEAARGVVAAAAALLEEQRTLIQEAALVDGRLDLAERELRSAEVRLATATANLEQRDRLQADVDAVQSRLAEADVELGRLRRLVAAFGVTGIPARIIEGVLPELASYANDLLGELRPGMTLELRAQREKRGGKGTVEALDLIVRDDVGERSLAMFSGGERMSVSLAIAVALSRLVARRAGSAIRSLVIDEPDGLDADARRSFGQALRVLAHRGDLERVVLVSHHPDLAEYADTVWSVSKSSSGSVVTEAA